MDQVKDGGPVAWMIRSRTGLIRCCLTEEPDDERRALAEIDGDTITPLFAAAMAATPAPANPAPGYCKHCKQYTIEEPLPAPAQAQQADEPHEVDIVRAAIAAMPHANAALADDLLSGFTMHTEMADVVAIYRAGMAATPAPAPLTDEQIKAEAMEAFDDGWTAAQLVVAVLIVSATVVGLALAIGGAA